MVKFILKYFGTEITNDCLDLAMVKRITDL